MKRSRLQYFLKGLLAASLVVNAVCFGFLGVSGAMDTLLNHGKFPLLSRRILSINPNDVIINFTQLRSELRSIINERKDMRVALYFEYLPSGVSIGVNEKESFISASLLKTPFIMGVFHHMERGFLREDAILTLKEDDLDPSYGTLWKEGAGYQLTVYDAIRRALQESDNTAVRTLDSLMHEDKVLEVYGALDIPLESYEDLVITTPKNYASIFRCLYLSCYLSLEGSQRILSILTNTEFHEGIAEGLPSAVPFAHKIGVFDQPGKPTALRLDCGIVYVPQRPYLLCMFVEGQKATTPEMYALMSDLSARIYRYVSEYEQRVSL